MLLAEGRQDELEIMEVIGISNDSMFSILNNHLGLRKMSVIWVLRLHTVDDIQNSVTTTKVRSALFIHN